jgi:phosphatidylserine/phosphatidylglycerophosphate/cardiolipin synthase-like enzyme
MNGIDVVSESILGRFAEVVYANKYRARDLWLVTPWLSRDDSREDPIAYLVEGLVRTHARVCLVTRPPTAAWHSSAIRILQQNLKTMVLLNPFLHAKVYLLECDGFRYALMGSANLTNRANIKNREVALEFRTTSQDSSDPIAQVIDSLDEYVRELRLDESSTLAGQQ